MLGIVQSISTSLATVVPQLISNFTDNRYDLSNNDVFACSVMTGQQAVLQRVCRNGCLSGDIANSSASLCRGSWDQITGKLSTFQPQAASASPEPDANARYQTVLPRLDNTRWQWLAD